MKNVTPIQQMAIGCLFLCLLATALGCHHGPNPRYALLLRKDLSAELWKLPGNRNQPQADKSQEEQPNAELLGDNEKNLPALQDEKENNSATQEERGHTKESGKTESCKSENCIVVSAPVCPKPCSRPPCRRPRQLFNPNAAGGGQGEENKQPEPPPMIAAHFFPVPTRPVFTPRGNLMNLNPHLQGIMPDSSFEVVPPGEVVPKTNTKPAPQVPEIEILPSPMPETSVFPPPSVPGSMTASARSFRPDWVFFKKAEKKPDSEKAYELIASGSQIMR